MSNYDTNLEENSKRFYKLANKLDRALRHFENNIYVINNPHIHLPRNHPQYLNVWKPVIYKKCPTVSDNFHIFLHLLKSMMGFILTLIKELFHNNYFVKKSDFTEMKIDYLFISHDVGVDEEDSDFYYGNILSELSVIGKKIVRLMIPQVKRNGPDPTKRYYRSIILDKPINNLTVFKYLFNNFKATFSITIFCMRNRYNLFEIFTIIGGQLNNFGNYRITHNIELFISKNKVKTLIMTFEGNAIERSIYFLSHKHHIICVGYQHAPIIKDQYSIFRSLSGKMDPDIILCSGHYTFEKFRSYMSAETPIFTIGSHKSIKTTEKKSNIYAYKKILLIPDGNSKSVNKFFDLGLFLSKKDSFVEVLIRSHPLQADNLKKRFDDEISTNFKNFIMSNNTLSIDLEASQWVVYENSSVSIQALLFGCEVIYLKNQLADVDPLWDLKDLHFSALNYEDIREIIIKYTPRPDAEKLKIKSFGRNYFSKLNKKIFLNELEFLGES